MPRLAYPLLTLALLCWVAGFALRVEADQRARAAAAAWSALEKLQDQYLQRETMRAIVPAATLRDEHYRPYMGETLGKGDVRRVFVLYISPTCLPCWQMFQSLRTILHDLSQKRQEAYELHLRWAPAFQETDLRWALYSECLMRNHATHLAQFINVFDPQRAGEDNYARSLFTQIGIPYQALAECAASDAAKRAVEADVRQRREYAHRFVPILFIDQYRLQGYSEPNQLRDLVYFIIENYDLIKES